MARQNKRGGKYWEDEQPLEEITGGIMLRHFVKAGKLQVCKTYEKDGKKFPGKCVTLDVEDFAVSPGALRMIAKFLKEAKDLAT